MVPRERPLDSAPIDWELRVFQEPLLGFLELLANCKNALDTRLPRFSHVVD